MNAPTTSNPKPLDTNELKEIANRIRARIRRTAEDIIAVGQDLAKVKSQLGHGKFLDWIDREFGMSERSARNYMSVAAWAEDKSATVADLAPSTLYLLASPSTPPEVTDEVVADIEAGKTIDPKETKARVKKARTTARDTKPQSDPETNRSWGSPEQVALSDFKRCLVFASVHYETAASIDLPKLDAEHRQAFIEVLKRTETIITDLRNKIENQDDLPPPNKPKEVVNDDDPLAIPPAFRRTRS